MFKELFILAGRNSSKLKALFILMALRAVFRVLPILILYLMVLDLLGTDTDLGHIVLLAAVLGIVYLGVNIWDHYMGIYAMRIGCDLCYDIRMELGNKLRMLPLGFFTKVPTGELNTLISEYVSRSETFVLISAPYLISSLLSALGLVVFFLILDWRIALAAGSTVLLSMSTFLYADRISKSVIGIREETLIRMNSIIVEFIQGMPVIKIFNQVASRFSKFQEAVKDFRDSNIKAVSSMIFPAILILTSSSLSIIFVLPIGLYLYLQGSLSLSTLAFFTIAAPSFSDSLSQFLYWYMHNKNSAGRAMESICRVLDEKPLHEPLQDINLETFDIEFADVFFAYDVHPILKALSFQVTQGTICALVGPSGSGKTTIVNLIARFWDVDSGEVKIGGRNVKDLKLDRLLSYLSIVSQEVVLFDDTIEKNIRLGREDASREEVIKAARLAQCHEFVERLSNGYDTVIGEKGCKLSGGERQRISIARALLKDAPIIILDEATAYVDPENEALIQKAINNLVKDKTVLIIAHRLSTVVHADQILVLKDGRIAERGNHDDLMGAGGLYSRMWEAHTSTQGWTIEDRRQYEAQADRIYDSHYSSGLNNICSK